MENTVITKPEKISILLVDDDVNIISLLNNIFKDIYQQIHKATSALEALEIVKNNHIDIVISDIKMPEVDGIELVCKIKEIDEKIQCVMITGFHDIESTMRALHAGAFAYINKPFNLDELIITVSRAVEKRLNALALINKQKELTRANEELIKLTARQQQVLELLKENEKKYKDMVEAVSDYIYSVKIDNNQVSTTSHGYGCLAVTGYHQNEFHENPLLWLTMVHNEDQKAVTDMGSKLASGKAVPFLEHRIIHKNGETRWVKNSTIIKKNEYGDILGYDGLITDISQQKKIENELAASHAIFHSIVERSRDGVLVLDQQGIVQFYNSAAAELFGSADKDLMGINLELPIVVNKTVEVSLSLKKLVILELITAETKWNNEKAYIISMRDITRHKNMVTELQKAKQIAEDANQAKGEFLANMSHELRNPLNSILLISNILIKNQEKNLLEKQIDLSRVIHDSGQELLCLINDLLDLSKVEAGKMQTNKTRAELGLFIQERLERFSPIAQEKGLILKSYLDKKLPASIYTDYQKLCQIINNLLGNSFKFTSKGEIWLKLSKPEPETQLPGGLTRDSTIIISVTDTGIGIAKEKYKLIFESFTQANMGTSKKYGGTGLGLSISREFASLLGGKIRVSSEEGKGSIFSLYLPIGNPEDEKITDQDIFVSQNQTTNKTSDKKQDIILPTYNFSGKTIMIVDDEMRNVIPLLTIIENCKAKVVIASNGLECLDKLKSSRNIDLILLDIMMPEIDGFEVLSRIRKNQQFCSLPIINITARGKAEDREKCLAAGADDFIAKPVSTDQLLEKISKLLADKSGGLR
jgi:PAS domain S-box-containing protein